MKPEAPVGTTLDSTLQVPVSSLVIPIRYHVDSLEKIINAKVVGTFVKQWVSVNAQHDSLYIELTSQGPIRLDWQNTTLLYRFPLHVEGKFIKHIGRKIRLQNEVPVSMDVILHMTTQLSFRNNWQLNPLTTLRHIEWTKEPELRIAFVTINLRKKLEGLIQENKPTLTHLVDRELSRLLDTKSIMEKLWVDIQKPILLNKENNVWLKHRAEGLQASLLQDGSYLGLDAHLQTRAYAILPGDSLPETNPTLPLYQGIDKSKDRLRLFIRSAASFKQINDLLQRQVVGRTIETEGYSTTIKRIQAYGTPDGIAMKIELRGDASGTLYVRGTPAYDTTTAQLTIRNFDFDVDSEDALVQSADWLLHDDALQQIQDKLSVNLAPLLAQLPGTITGAVEKGKTGEKMELFITALRVQPETFLITQKDIQLILKAEGRVVVGLQKELFRGKAR